MILIRNLFNKLLLFVLYSKFYRLGKTYQKPSKGIGI